MQNVFNILNQLKIVLLGFAEVLLAIKFVPSIITIGYGFFCWHVWGWFEKLPAPTTEQTAALTTVFGLATVVFGLYLNSGLNGVNWNQINNIRQITAQRLKPPSQ